MNNRLAHSFFLLFLLVHIFSVQCQTETHEKQPVLTGLDQVHEYQHFFVHKNIGIISNHTAVNRRGEHITDIFLNMPDVQIVALFGPEHGVRGQAAAGESVDSRIDPLKNIPIYSLYGSTKKPTPDMLKNINVLVFDIQDIGARFYTYIWTMFYAQQAAAENNITFVVLDRPNPITGKIEGPVLEKEFSSFIGLQPIPVRHGMTVGELAKMFYGEGWIGDLKLDLVVIPVKNWHRKMWFDECGLEFIPPSPNMPTLETATIYPGTCLLEGTNVSEGRGTESPFLIFGAPWINAERLCAQLNKLELTGVHFEPADFTPTSLPVKAPNPKYENQLCCGAKIVITNRDEFNVFQTGILMIKTLHDMYPNNFAFRPDGFFDKLCGTDTFRIGIKNGESVQNIFVLGQKDQEAFLLTREKYLLYP